MSKSTFDDWSTTAIDNEDVGGISILGSAHNSNVDNALREIMKQLAVFRETIHNRFNIRQFGSWETDNDALTNTTTLIAAYNAMVTAGGGSTLIPPGTFPITAPVATRVSEDNGTCLIMDHSNGATIEFVGTEGATFLKPASNAIEIFGKDGDFNFILDGVGIDNSANGILQLQVKPGSQTKFGGIAGLGNGANCVLRQYSGSGLAALRNVTVKDVGTIQDHRGVLGEQTTLKGVPEQTNCSFDGYCFGLLAAQPEEVVHKDVAVKNGVDSNNGNNTDGTETDTTVVSTDPGHAVYMANRPGAPIVHQQYSGLRATGGVSSPLKVRKGENVVMSDVSFMDSGRGIEIWNNKRAVVSNVVGRLGTTTSGNNSALELSGAGSVTASNCRFDITDRLAWGLRMRSDDTEINFDIAAITQDDPCVVTTDDPHGLSNGTVVGFYEVGGMTELNGQRLAISNVTSTTFEVDIDSTGYGAFTSGGFITGRPWSNRYHHLSNFMVRRNFWDADLETPAASNGRSSYLITDQYDSIFQDLVEVHEGQHPGRAVVDMRGCVRCIVVNPRKIAPASPQFSDRLVVLDENCRDCIIFYTDDCVPGGAPTGSTIVDNGTNNRIINVSSGPFKARAGSAATPSYGFEDEAGFGWDRNGTGDMRLAVSSAYVLRFLAGRMEGMTAGAYSLGASTMPFGRVFANAAGLTTGQGAPSATTGQVLIYVDNSTQDITVRWPDNTTKTLISKA